MHVRGASSAGKLSEQVFPDPPSRPAHKPIVDRRRRTIFGRAIAPAAAAFQHMNDAADDPTIIYTLYTADIRRQVRFDPVPLFVAQPK